MMGSGGLRLSTSRRSAEGGNSKSGPKLTEAVPPMYRETGSRARGAMRVMHSFIC